MIAIRAWVDIVQGLVLAGNSHQEGKDMASSENKHILDLLEDKDKKDNLNEAEVEVQVGLMVLEDLELPNQEVHNKVKVNGIEEVDF